MSPETAALLPLWYVVFLLSTTCHEAAHALVAWLGGDRTAYLGGQVSLNPWPHIRREPFGTVLVPLLSYLLYGMGGGGRWMVGWASAPYDPVWAERHPRRAAAMAVAGPAANLLLAALALVTLRLGLGQGWWVPPSDLHFDRLVTDAMGSGMAEGIGRFCSVLFTLNLVLCLLNLIPIPPLDGAAVAAGLLAPVRSLLARGSANPMMGLIGLLVAWRVFPHLFFPVYQGLLGLFLYG